MTEALLPELSVSAVPLIYPLSLPGYLRFQFPKKVIKWYFIGLNWPVKTGISGPPDLIKEYPGRVVILE
ncbi:MAG: hypothetical protein J0I20_04605 [Chloroflexi bacterium]|nr:hypothetical protein [Chloroflexota bacterium]